MATKPLISSQHLAIVKQDVSQWPDWKRSEQCDLQQGQNRDLKRLTLPLSYSVISRKNDN